MSMIDGFAPATLEGGVVRHGDDSNLIVEFYWKDKLNQTATEKAGRPIYKQVPYIHIMIPGDKTTDMHRPVQEKDKARFPRHWALFEAEEEQITEGTPLNEWTVLNVAQRSELKALGFKTVENVASMSDVQMDRIGMGAQKLKRMAQGYLDRANESVGSAQMASELDKRDAEIASLKAQLEQVLDQLGEAKKSPAKADDEPAPEPKADAGDEEDGDTESSLAGFEDDDESLPEPQPVAKKRGRPRKKAA